LCRYCLPLSPRWWTDVHSSHRSACTCHNANSHWTFVLPGTLYYPDHPRWHTLCLLLLLKEGDCCIETNPVKLGIVPCVLRLDCADLLGLSLYGFVPWLPIMVVERLRMVVLPLLPLADPHCFRELARGKLWLTS
jgi:hypothetical protein